MKHNIWILAIENNNPITAAQAVQDLQDLQHSDKQSDHIKMVLAKRSSNATKTQIEQNWATCDQMRIVPHHTIDSDTVTAILESQRGTIDREIVIREIL